MDRRFLLYSTGLADSGTALNVPRYQVYTFNNYPAIFDQLPFYAASFALFFTSDHQHIIVAAYLH